MSLRQALAPTLAAAALLLLLGACGADKNSDVIEFTSDASDEELSLSDALINNNIDTNTEPARTTTTTGTTHNPESIHFLTSGFDQPFNKVQQRIFQALVNQDTPQTVTYHDSKGDPQDQAAKIAALTRAGTKGIILCPIRCEPLKNAVDRALQQSIPVVVIGASPEQLKGTINLAVDHHRIGELAAEFAISRIKMRMGTTSEAGLEGRIIEITGTDDLQTDAERARSEGFSSVIGQYPGVLIVHQAPGYWNEIGGAGCTLEAIELQEDTDIIFAHNDAMAVGAYAALRKKELESNYLIVGIDGIGGSSGGISRVRDQMLAATVAVPPLALQASQAILALIDDKKPAIAEIPDPELVTIANSREKYERHLLLPFGLQEDKK